MKKVLTFFGAAIFVAAMTVACGHKNAEATTTPEETTVEAVAEEAAPAETGCCTESNADAMMAAAKEAGQAICNCTNGDAASIESCMKSVLEASYAQYQGNEEFTAAVKAEINSCIKEKATAAATEAVNEGVKAGANALAKKLAEKK